MKFPQNTKPTTLAKILFMSALFFAVLSLTILFVFPNSASANNGVEKVQVIIGFNDFPSKSEENLISKNGGALKHTFHLVPAIAATIPETAIEGLSRNPRIAYIEEDGTLAPASQTTPWGISRIEALTAHAEGYTGAGVKVAVIDSGINYNHVDLNYAGGYDFVHNDNDPLDDQGHGTHVAGTIAALDNDTGVVGVAPNVELYALKVLNSEDYALWSDVARAVEWAVDNGMQVTNTSLVGPQSSLTMEQAYQNAYNQGVLHVASAGNSGNCKGKRNTVTYPAKLSSIIAVAATDPNDERPCWSSTGDEIEISAPGEGVYSTLMNGGYGTKSGTSMASPHVVGVAALLIEAGIEDENGNGFINDELRAVLTSTASDLGTAGFDKLYGHGLVDIMEAIAVVTGTSTPPTEATEVLVSDISYSASGGKGGDKDLNLSFSISDEFGAWIASANLMANIALNGQLYFSADEISDSNGSISLKFRNAPSGCYEALVTSLTATNLTWNGLTPVNSFCK